MIKANLSLPPKIPPKETPYFGMVPIPQHDFPEQFSNFCFNSLYIKEEVIRCMVEIRDDCNNLLKDNRIFDVSVKNKTLRVEEFKQLQSSSIATIKFNTRESGWVGRLEKIIKTSFNDVGKGWFNIHETSKETYEFGKLKKFLTLVNFMMQDTVLTLCKDSVKEFVAYVLAFCPTSTTIESTSKVQNQFPEREIEEEDEEIDPYQEDDYTQTPDDQLDRFQIEKKFLQIRFAKNRDPDPLFILDLNLKKGQIIPQYSTDPADIVSKIMEVFDEGIKCLQAIPQLEPILLKHLFKTHKKTLKAPTIPLEKPALPDPAKKHILPDENTWLWEASNQIRQELKKQIAPLADYVQTFKQFEPESKLNPEQFVKALDDREGGISPEELKYDIQLHREEEDKLKTKIPEQITVGIFAINCKDIRSFYAGKHTQIVDKEIKLIAQKAKEMNYEITTKFDEINERIKRPPKDIQDLTETKKYIAEIGAEIEKKKKDIDYCMGIYSMLDEENFEFTSTEQDSKW